MLHLILPTDPRWVNLTEKSYEEILTDHAYCEMKAAISGISLIQLYPDREKLVDEVAPLITEEWGHFRMVMKELKKRNLKLGKQRRDQYVHQLKLNERNGGREEERLLDKLLVFALIEARSCERFKLLSEELEDESLKKFYRHFMESEAGHYTLFMDIARFYIDEKKVDKRWNEFLELEKNILKKLELRGDRIH